MTAQIPFEFVRKNFKLNYQEFEMLRLIAVEALKRKEVVDRMNLKVRYYHCLSDSIKRKFNSNNMANVVHILWREYVNSILE